jgi:glycosyltransferase involved in cell wall biosynthesis
MVRIAYIAQSRIPSRAANSVQIMKMAEELLVRDPLLLMIAARGTGDDNLRCLYGVRRLPRMERLPIMGRFGPHLFALKAAWTARLDGARLVITRSVIVAGVVARLGLDVIFECHAPPQGGERIFWRVLRGSKRLRRLVLISDALKGIMADAFPETRKMDVLVAHDGVDIDRFAKLPTVEAAKVAECIAPNRMVAGYAGHLYMGRGIEIILACAMALPRWLFRLAGGTTNDIAHWRAQVRSLGLLNVEFLGFIDNASLPVRMACCDALLMPYQRRVLVAGGNLDTAHWMSPLKMFEYLAMARAIVSSDLPVLREVLTDDAALLVPPDDPNAWIQALRYIEDDNVRRAYAEASGTLVARYTWSRRVANILEGIT